MKNKFLACLVAVLLGTVGASAQSLWTSADMETKVAKKLKAFAGAEFRTQDEFSGIERWSGNVGLQYKVNKHISLAGGYAYIHQQVDDKFTKRGNFIPGYWQSKHRGFFNVTGRYKWERFTFSLRERYQYTYRPEQSVPKYDSDGVTPKEDEWMEGVGKNVLRSRLKVDYNIRKSAFKPYASCEFYNSLDDGFAVDKVRWTFGTSYRFNKRHSVELYYRYIDRSDDEEDAGNVIGIGYSFKL